MLVQLEPRFLEVLDHPLGELVVGIIRGMFSSRQSRSRLRVRAKPIENNGLSALSGRSDRLEPLQLPTPAAKLKPVNPCN